MNKITTYPWAQEMIQIIQPIVPEFVGLMSLGDFSFHRKRGWKVVAAFTEAGFEPYEQIPGFWVIESKSDSTVGITVDFRPDMNENHLSCTMTFYDDTH